MNITTIQQEAKMCFYDNYTVEQKGNTAIVKSVGHSTPEKVRTFISHTKATDTSESYIIPITDSKIERIVRKYFDASVCTVKQTKGKTTIKFYSNGCAKAYQTEEDMEACFAECGDECGDVIPTYNNTFVVKDYNE